MEDGVLLPACMKSDPSQTKAPKQGRAMGKLNAGWQQHTILHCQATKHLQKMAKLQREDSRELRRLRFPLIDGYLISN
jgi:hypothetical protein